MVPPNQSRSQTIPFTVKHEEKLEKHDNDLYEGDGPRNPSITIRLDRLEQMTVLIRWFIGVVAAVGVATIGDIISLHLK